MNLRIAIVILTTSACVLPVFADNSTTGTPVSVSTAPTTNATTIAASKVISPGSYTASIAPSLNVAMSDRMEKALKNVPGLTSVSSHANDSSIHFTVKNGAVVREADIQKAVGKADAGSVMSEPILEHSLTANPGL